MKLNKCIYCHEDIQIPYRKNTSYLVSPANYQKMKFCGRKCKVTWQKEHLIGNHNYNFRGGKSLCADCGKKLPHRYTKSITRCRDCWYKHNTREHNPNWKGGSFCKDCGVAVSCSYNRCRACYGKSVSGSNSPVYKEKLSYKYLHNWVKKELGSPSQCAHCGTQGHKHKGVWNIHWANISKEYLRDLSDWIGLCPSCHVNFDKKN